MSVRTNPQKWHGIAALGIIVLIAIICQGCGPTKLKTVTLNAVAIQTGTSGAAGSVGWCFGPGNIPPTAFSPGGNVMVGFDNYYNPGTSPFNCEDIRATLFRGGVRFDLSQFDSITTADLSFETANSAMRSGGETIGTNPATSYATTLGVSTQDFTTSSTDFPFDNDASLPTGPNISISVSSQVRDWINKTRPNFGFIIAGPTGLVDPNNPPKNNDAKVSWYRTFQLKILYNPSQNPRAPQ